jgi:phosphatidylglycerophosphatase A
MQKNNKSLPKNLVRMVFTDWRYFIGFGFGSGLLPKIPGTWGSLAAIPFVCLLKLCPLWVYWSLTLIYFFLGAWLSEILSKKLGIHDYGGVNCDEILGMLVLMAPFELSVLNVIVGFILFRIFDILKPFPVGWIDKHIDGGIGMMLDDVAAALLSIISLGVLHFWI